jgi:L-ascorbate metabolism protein UlaG (beta-lactamase superfamily)
MARSLRRTLLALLLAAAPACAFPAHFVAGNLEAFFRAPAPVPHKVRRPFRPDARLAVLWVGHATALIQIDDKLILTDPVFTSTVGVLSKRLVEPGLDPADLPPLSAVLISHMHFDHLSLGSLEMIEDKARVVLVPRGGLVYLPGFAFETVELGAWERWERDGLRITAAPVKHQGDRYRLDGAWMTDSFTGWVVEHNGLTVYFGGDTGYHPRLFRKAGARFPSIDVALLPIAPIQPRDWMRPKHTDPGEAVQIFFDLGARWMIPIHYDTFVNSMDEPGDAVAELRRVIAKRGLDRDRVQILAHGEQRVLVPRSGRPAGGTPERERAQTSER